jgi:hypothetical protein
MPSPIGALQVVTVISPVLVGLFTEKTKNKCLSEAGTLWYRSTCLALLSWGQPEYYKGVLERLRNDVHRKQPEKWANGFILHHDNTPCHTSLLVQQFLSYKNTTVCPHSPDLAPCDFRLFPIVKMTM